MTSFFLFVVIAIVIGVFNVIAKVLNQQQEAERRRRFREMMEQSQQQQATATRGGTFASGPAIRPPPPLPAQRGRQLNPAYAVRHPEMVSPPPPQRRPAPRQQPQSPQRRKQASTRRNPVVAAPPPIPVLEADDEPTSRLVATNDVAAKPQAATTVTAPAIKRWLQPATLRQQFILTELFQPPLALRGDDHASP